MLTRIIIALIILIGGSAVLLGILAMLFMHFFSQKRCLGCKWFNEGYCSMIMDEADDLDLACDNYEDGRNL